LRINLQNLVSSGISRASGAVSGSPGEPFSAAGDASLSANIELLPQLSVNGSFSAAHTDADISVPDPPFSPLLGGSIGLNFTPLADTTERPRDLLEIERTGVQLESAVRAASFAAISRLLDAVMAELQIGLDEMEHSVAEQVLHTTSLLYEKEQATETAYTAAKNTLRSRSHDLLLSSLAAEKTLEYLAQIIAVPVDQFRVPTLKLLELDSLAGQGASFLDSPDLDLLAERAAGVRHAFLDVEEAEIDLSGARVFSPSLSVTASTALPDLDYSVGAQFSFSISDFDLEARDSAQTNLSHTFFAYENRLRMAHLDVRRAILELEFALEELEAARESLAESQLGLAEVQYFAKQGKATELELTQSELSVRIAENNVVSAEIEVASRWFAIEFAQY
jgi:outer membrane protein TolC